MENFQDEFHKRACREKKIKKLDSFLPEFNVLGFADFPLDIKLFMEQFFCLGVNILRINKRNCKSVVGEYAIHWVK